ncbi:MAG: hypothetical protein ACW986_13925 [Promethearchaeota archaeon]
MIITRINVGNENQKSQNRIMIASNFPPKYADMVPTASPPRVPIITGSAAADRAVLDPQINLARMSNPYSVVPNGCSADGGRYGVSGRKSGGTILSNVNLVKKGEYTPKTAINKIITIPAIVKGVRRRLNNLLFDFILPISYSVASNSGSR